MVGTRGFARRALKGLITAFRNSSRVLYFFAAREFPVMVQVASGARREKGPPVPARQASKAACMAALFRSSVFVSAAGRGEELRQRGARRGSDCNLLSWMTGSEIRG